MPPSPPPSLLRHHSIRLCRVSVGSSDRLGSHHQVRATDRQSPDIPRNAGPIQLAAPPQSECIASSRIVPRPSASRRAATNRAPPLSNHEELRFDKGSTQRAHWAGAEPSSAAENLQEQTDTDAQTGKRAASRQRPRPEGHIKTTKAQRAA